MNHDALYALWLAFLLLVLVGSIVWSVAEHEMSYRRARRTTPPPREDAPSEGESEPTARRKDAE